MMPGNGIGYEEEIAAEICDGLPFKAGRLVLSRPQFWYITPGPGRRQEAVYQHCLLTCGSFLRLIGGGPVLFGGRLDKRRELTDNPGDYWLRRVEDSAHTSWVMFCRM